MDIIDKYFEVVGDRLDYKVMKYFGFDRNTMNSVKLRLANKLGLEGIDKIIKEKTKDVINIQSGGYNLNVYIKNWDITKSSDGWSVDDIDVAVDPKSTIETMTTSNTYRLGDLYSYSDIDELNADYNTEDNPITDDDINEIGYEVQDMIRDWMYDEIHPLTGVGFDDVYPDNEKVDQLVEKYGLNEQYEDYDIESFAQHADIFEKMWKGFQEDNLLRTYIQLRMKLPKREQYVDYFYNFIRNNGDRLKRKEDRD